MLPEQRSQITRAEYLGARPKSTLRPQTDHVQPMVQNEILITDSLRPPLEERIHDWAG